jgi:hypothetical protein
MQAPASTRAERNDFPLDAVERAINNGIDDFMKMPYRHRVEHSFHCDLYRGLIGVPELNQKLVVGSFVTRMVHKEWPETKPRPHKGNRRGNFDLAILDAWSSALNGVSIKQFREGRIVPEVAIEVGLDRNLQHLEEDVQKLRDSKVVHGYVIHLVRQQHRLQSRIQDCVRMLMEDEKAGGPRIAFAQLLPNGVIRYRHLNETEIGERSA